MPAKTVRLKTSATSANERPVALLWDDPSTRDELEIELNEHGYDVVRLSSKLGELTKDQIVTRLVPLLDEMLQMHVPILLHPGAGEAVWYPELASIAQQRGIPFFGPPLKTIHLFTNRLSFLERCKEKSIPTLVLSFEPIQSRRELEERLDHPFPIVLRAVWQSTWLNLLVLQSEADLQDKFPVFIEELRHRSVEPLCFFEKYLDGGRLLSLPFYVTEGDIGFFNPVDLSLQKKNKPLLEFCPPYKISTTLTGKLKEISKKILADLPYQGYGSFEFLVEDDKAYIVGATPGLQLHSLHSKRVTEKKQAGVQLHLYSEDSVLELPRSGIVREIGFESEKPVAATPAKFTVGPGEKLNESCMGRFGVIQVSHDNSEKLLERAAEILDGIWISGEVQDEKVFLKELLTHPFIREGVFHASFLEEEFISTRRSTPELHRLAAQLVQSMKNYASGTSWRVNQYRLSLSDAENISYEWAAPAQDFIKHGMQGVLGKIRLKDSPKTLRVAIEPLSKHHFQVHLDSWWFEVRAQDGALTEKKKPVYSLVDGKIIDAFVKANSNFPAQKPLFYVLSLGRVIPHAIPVSGYLVEWKKQVGDIVRRGETIAEIEIQK